ncbi:DM DNA binding domain-containing protein [Ditylenchus destructor]|uniref:DM DNA binding domain-containing protein n=1 Tax=Ditylenchus destructor TaxID=166010 RepID=A0AAD4QUW1_9BILA|nr:DM DNA binding domain-containing protein [Ditylenchus destructor]
MFSVNNIFEVLNNGKLNMENCNLLTAKNNQCKIMSSALKPGPRYHKEHPPYCHCCANHDVQSRLKGHKNCPFQSCECLKCKIVKRRRRLMAEQIKERRRQRKLAKAAKALKNNTVDLPTNQDFDFAALCFVPEEPFNVPEINPQLIFDTLQLNSGSIEMTMTDPTLQFDGINSPDIGFSSTAASISPNESIATMSDEMNISALALLESLRMASLAPPAPTFSIPPPLNLCALQPGIPYSSMDVPVSPTMPLPMFPPNETFTYSNSEFSLPNTFLQQIQQSFFNDFLPLS